MSICSHHFSFIYIYRTIIFQYLELENEPTLCKEFCFDDDEYGFDLVNYVVNENVSAPETLLEELLPVNMNETVDNPEDQVSFDVIFRDDGTISLIPQHDSANIHNEVHVQVEEPVEEPVIEHYLQTSSEVSTALEEPSRDENSDGSFKRSHRGRPLGKLSHYIEEVKACGRDKGLKKVKKNNVSSFLYRQRRKQTAAEMENSIEKYKRKNNNLRKRFEKNTKCITFLQQLLKQLR